MTSPSSDMEQMREAVAYFDSVEIDYSQDVYPTWWPVLDAARRYVRGEELKDATIRDKRGKYRSGDFIVIPVSDGGSET